MTSLRALLLATIFGALVTACGGDTTDPGRDAGGTDAASASDGSAPLDGEAPASDAAGSDATTAPDGAMGGDAGTTALPTCQEACSTSSDCASASASVDSDNWACESRVCRYLGCHDDAECQATFGGAGGTWACDLRAALPACVERCTVRDDCASASATVDADNWACDAGLCRYQGCNDDAECQATFGASGGTWACTRSGALGLCVERCATRDDCASASGTVDADNWSCEGGRCAYLGCNDDTECQSTFGAAGGTWECVGT